LKERKLRIWKAEDICITGELFEMFEAAFDRKKEQSGRWLREFVQDMNHPMESK
jgi:hypothetical protein